MLHDFCENCAPQVVDALLMLCYGLLFVYRSDFSAHVYGSQRKGQCHHPLLYHSIWYIVFKNRC